MRKQYKEKVRIRTGRMSYGYNGLPINRIFLIRVFQFLHHHSAHQSPQGKKWRAAEVLFMNKHFGQSGTASMRYLNNWSCHSWM